MSSSRRFRPFLGRVGQSIKDVFKSSDQASASRAPSRTSSPPPRATVQDPLPQLTLQSPPSPAQSQSPIHPAQPALGSNQPAPTTSLLAVNNDQPARASNLSLAAQKLGKDAWAGLKLSLQLLEKSSDVFPPVKSAVAGFLGVVDIFEVRHSSLYIPVWYSQLSRV